MLRLPATAYEFQREALTPALALLPPKLDAPEARLLLIAIALQESGLRHRWQIVDPQKPDTKGPARGLLQFERGGGVRGVMKHPATNHLAQQVCAAREVGFDENLVWRGLESDDILAAAFGRLLLLADPKPLAPLGDELGAWECYISAWRPGKPHVRTWSSNYAQAFAALA